MDFGYVSFLDLVDDFPYDFHYLYSLPRHLVSHLSVVSDHNQNHSHDLVLLFDQNHIPDLFVSIPDLNHTHDLFV
jgi:hypothetical protein